MNFSFFGLSAKLHHIGIAVTSIATAMPEIERTHDRTQGVRVGFFRSHDVVIELIEPAAADSPVQQSIEQGRKILHLCFEVDDLEAAVESGREAGFLQIRPPTPATAFEGRRITWVFSRELGLVELLERAKPPSAAG